MNHQQRNAFLGLVNKLHLHPTIKKMVFDNFKEITCWVFERGMIVVPWETKAIAMKGKETTPETWPVTTAGEAPKNKREIVVDAIEKEGGIGAVILKSMV